MSRRCLVLSILLFGLCGLALSSNAANDLPRSSVLDKAWLSYQRHYDGANGGVKGSPKRPLDVPVRFLLREQRRVKSQQALRMARRTLDAMQQGGIYDAVAGGFYDYALDVTWENPHLDKNLVVNARLALAYVEAYQVTGNQSYAETASATLRFAMRELTDSDGLFFSGQRVDPRDGTLRDERKIVAWNALMISSLVRAGEALEEPEFSQAALRGADAILENGFVEGRLSRVLPAEGVTAQGELDDHVFLEASLIDLFEATAQEKWLASATSLQETLDQKFWDAKEGGYFSTAVDHEEVLAREKSLRGGALPSGNAVAAMNLLRLYSLTASDEYRRRAQELLRAFDLELAEAPGRASEMLLALDFYFDTPKEILIVAPEDRNQADPFVRQLHATFVPNRILVVVSQEEAEKLSERLPVFQGKRALGGAVTAYVCENHTCERPVTALEDFREQLLKSDPR